MSLRVRPITREEHLAFVACPPVRQPYAGALLG